MIKQKGIYYGRISVEEIRIKSLTLVDSVSATVNVLKSTVNQGGGQSIMDEHLDACNPIQWI